MWQPPTIPTASTNWSGSAGWGWDWPGATSLGTTGTPRWANTADGYAGWASLVATPQPGERVLVVTTDLFVPFQHCDAVRLLGLAHGCEIDTVGFAPIDYPQWLPPYSTTHLLMEVRSAILSMCTLYEEWQEAATRR